MHCLEVAGLGGVEEAVEGLAFDVKLGRHFGGEDFLWGEHLGPGLGLKQTTGEQVGNGSLESDGHYEWWA